MFILDKSKFGDFNLKNTKEFIEFWKQYYPEDTTKIFGDNDKKIDYITELNLGNNLNDENIKRLLRWKYPRWLTEKKYSGEDNKTVNKVLNELKSINDFRHNQINKDLFLEKVKEIFSDGLIYRIFLFHIARPLEYPIADQYVFLAFSVLKKDKIPEDWNDYNKYKEFFFDIAKSAGISQENKNNISVLVSQMKEVDDALFAYGQFLNYYNK